MGLVKMESERKKRKKNGNSPFIKTDTMRTIATNVVIFIVVAIYCVLGAYILIWIEKPEEEIRANAKTEAIVHIGKARKYLIDDAWFQSSQNLEKKDFSAKMRRNLNLFKSNIIELSNSAKYDGNKPWKYDWTLTKSLLFTVTTVGAIGYGHIYPTTGIGQLFTIYYGMLGIPLLLLFLANIGNMMGKCLKYVYSRLCCRWCRVRRKISEWKGNREKIPSRIINKDEVGMESYMPTDLTEVPIMVNLMVIALYLAIGGIYFAYSEYWEIHEAVYFSFITLTTIGFGDYVPGKTFYDSDEIATLVLKLLVTIFYCLFGMALLSMAIGLMQEQIVQNARWLGSQTGIIEEDYDPIERYKITHASESNMVITPSGMDGNQKERLLEA